MLRRVHGVVEGGSENGSWSVGSPPAAAAGMQATPGDRPIQVANRAVKSIGDNSADLASELARLQAPSRARPGRGLEAEGHRDSLSTSLTVAEAQ